MFLSRKKYLNTGQIRLFATQIKDTWNSAKPYRNIPSPSTFKLIRSYLPGGQFSDLNYLEVHEILRNTFGPIYKIKGIFGKRDLIIVDDPKDFEVVFRTVGAFPLRRGLESLSFYRKVHRKESYLYTAGVFVEQGQAWWDLRQKLNGILLKPQVVNHYVSHVDEITLEFIAKLHNLRDINLETPPNLLNLVNNWALESISYIATNYRLKLFCGKPHESAEKFIDYTKSFFEMTYEFDFQPSLWKIYKTSKFKYFLRLLDEWTDIVEEFVENGLENLKKDKDSGKKRHCIIEELCKIDKDAAKIVVCDLIMAGVETTSTGALAVFYNLAKNPDKQIILREELLKVLPEKNSPLTGEKMKNLPYLRACIKEAMRLMPITSGIIRGTGQDIVLSGYQIPKDTDVFVQNEALYRNDHFFPQADAFLPERWLRSQEKHRNYNPFVYLPFGYGHRICLGRRLANLQIETLISRLVRNYHLEWNHPPPKIRSTTVNLPYGNLKLKLKEI